MPLSARRTLTALALGLCLAGPALAASSTLRVMSWNLRHEGWSGDDNYAADAQQIWQNFGSAASSSAGCDLVLLQEVMSTAVAPAVVTQLNTLSGYPWSYAVVGPVGRSSYKEYYAVLYRTDRVTLVYSYLWNDSGDKFEREPQIVMARDKVTSADYTFINWHTIWGDTTQRQAEIAAIANVFTTVQNGDGTDQDVMIIGDHNAAGDASVSWWNALRSLSPLVFCGFNDVTTLTSTGSFVSAYDHVWLQPSYVTEFAGSGRDYISNPVSFYALSDHAPIWLKLYSTSDTD